MTSPNSCTKMAKIRLKDDVCKAPGQFKLLGPTHKEIAVKTNAKNLESTPQPNCRKLLQRGEQCSQHHKSDRRQRAGRKQNLGNLHHSTLLKFTEGIMDVLLRSVKYNDQNVLIYKIELCD